MQSAVEQLPKLNDRQTHSELTSVLSNAFRKCGSDRPNKHWQLELPKLVLQVLEEGLWL